MQNDKEKCPESPARPEDKRAAELEYLRARNVAKTIQVQLDGKGQPINKESFEQQRKEQVEQIRKQQMDAASNLHNFRNKNVVAGDDVKQQLKKKEMEAAAMLRNYRGSPDAVLSHQVKKISTAGVNDNYFQAHTFSPLSTPNAAVIDAKGIETKFKTQPPPQDARTFEPAASNASLEDPPSLQAECHRQTTAKTDNEDDIMFVSEDAGVDDFLASLDDQFLAPAAEIPEVVKPEVTTAIDSNNDNDKSGEMEKLQSESSNGSTNDMAEWVDLAEDENPSRKVSDDFTRIDYEANGPTGEPASQPQESTGSEEFQPPTPQWKNERLSISFGLLTGQRDAPQEGSTTDNELLHGMVNKMRSTILFCLETYDQNNDVKLIDEPFNISVTKDGKISQI